MPHLCGHSQGKPALAHATRSGQGDEPRSAQQLTRPCHLVPSPDETCRICRKISGIIGYVRHPTALSILSTFPDPTRPDATRRARSPCAWAAHLPAIRGPSGVAARAPPSGSRLRGCTAAAPKPGPGARPSGYRTPPHKQTWPTEPASPAQQRGKDSSTRARCSAPTAVPGPDSGEGGLTGSAKRPGTLSNARSHQVDRQPDASSTCAARRCVTERDSTSRGGWHTNPPAGAAGTKHRARCRERLVPWLPSVARTHRSIPPGGLQPSARARALSWLRIRGTPCHRDAGQPSQRKTGPRRTAVRRAAPVRRMHVVNR
ncbi:hypothetical protein EES37_16555 [Streptomyces sp. ADI91-18]|nr:hypothetical protein EES37_16555 [Streptomyces sp. ADI91-18]